VGTSPDGKTHWSEIMSNRKKYSIQTIVSAVALSVLLSLIVVDGERQHAAVYAAEAVTAPATSSAVASGNADYFPSHFAAPTGAVEDQPPTF
jgi:hypothetical protein